MKALSIRQPWAWAILHAGKRVENRTWNTSYRGPVLIHAAKGGTRSEQDGALRWMLDRGLIRLADCPTVAHIQRGGIVGMASIVNVLPQDVGAGWKVEGQYGFVLADVEPLPFLPMRGSLGLFKPAAYADGCGYCSHPSRDGGVCGLGAVRREATTVREPPEGEEQDQMSDIGRPHVAVRGRIRDAHLDTRSTVGFRCGKCGMEIHIHGSAIRPHCSALRSALMAPCACDDGKPKN